MAPNISSPVTLASVIEHVSLEFKCGRNLVTLP